jgi:hypothetical protein
MSNTESKFTIELDGEPKLELDDITKINFGTAMTETYKAFMPFVKWMSDPTVPLEQKAPYENALVKTWSKISDLANFMLFVGFTEKELEKIINIPF